MIAFIDYTNDQVLNKDQVNELSFLDESVISLFDTSKLNNDFL